MKYLYYCIFIATLILSMLETAHSKPLVADLDQRHIEIHSGFNGTKLLLFGARHDAGDIVVTLRGPEQHYIVRKKERTAGIWINRRQATFTLPGYFSIASSKKLDFIKNENLLNSLDINYEFNHVKLHNTALPANNPEPLRQALINQKQKENLYPQHDQEHAISFIGDSLFRSLLPFPEKIPRGTYTAEIHLFNDGQLLGVQTTPITVKKTGLDAFLHDAAYKHSFWYGLLAIFLALGAGWLANFVFQR